MGVRDINKAQKRVMSMKSEYGEYSNSWHIKGRWCAYVKWQHSKALRSEARAIVRDELEQMNKQYVVQVPAKRKRSEEAKRIRQERWNAHWAFWEVRRLQQGLPPWGEVWEPRLSPWRKQRSDSYKLFCRTRRIAYWRKFVC